MMRIEAFRPEHVDMYEEMTAEERMLVRKCGERMGYAMVSVLAPLRQGSGGQDGERVVGIIGWIIADNEAVVSMVLSDRLRRHPMFLHRWARRGMRMLRGMGIERVRATAETEAGRRWLARLGVEPALPSLKLREAGR